MVRGNMLGDEISEFFSEWLYLLLSYLFSSNNFASKGDEIEVEG